MRNSSPEQSEPQQVHSLYCRLEPNDSAVVMISAFQKKFIIVFLIVFVLALIWDWHTTFIVTIAFLTFVYFSDLLFNMYLIYRSFSAPEITITEKELRSKPDKEWPLYTILCPLYT